jgi:hypothetical protein
VGWEGMPKILAFGNRPNPNYGQPQKPAFGNLSNELMRNLSYVESQHSKPFVPQGQKINAPQNNAYLDHDASYYNRIDPRMSNQGQLMESFGGQQMLWSTSQMNQATLMAIDLQNQRYSMNTNDIVQRRNQEMQGQVHKAEVLSRETSGPLLDPPDNQTIASGVVTENRSQLGMIYPNANNYQFFADNISMAQPGVPPPLFDNQSMFSKHSLGNVDFQGNRSQLSSIFHNLVKLKAGSTCKICRTTVELIWAITLML